MMTLAIHDQRLAKPGPQNAALRDYDSVRRVSHRGDVAEWVLNPLWVQLDHVTHAEFGIEQLFLVSRGRRVSIARFLGPDEKASFCKALRAALQAAKRGPTYNPVT